MADALKATPGYAESQIRLLLSELNNASHTNKLVAIKNFNDYLNKYKPEVYDDAVDYFLKGTFDNGNFSGSGILYHCGVESSSHEGSLKRICPPALSLLTTLIGPKSPYADKPNNMFLDRLIRLPINELVKINFAKHIIPNQGKVLTKITGNITGNANKQTLKAQRRDALELLSLLIYDHLNSDDEPETLDIDQLLNFNNKAKEKLKVFMKKHETERVSTHTLYTHLM